MEVISRNWKLRLRRDSGEAILFLMGPRILKDNVFWGRWFALILIGFDACGSKAITKAAHFEKTYETSSHFDCCTPRTVSGIRN